MSGACTICRRGFVKARPRVNFIVGETAHTICGGCARMPDKSIREAIALRVDQPKEIQ